MLRITEINKSEPCKWCKQIVTCDCLEYIKNYKPKKQFDPEFWIDFLNDEETHWNDINTPNGRHFMPYRYRFIIDRLIFRWFDLDKFNRLDQMLRFLEGFEKW